ncbi:MAG: glycogen debranching enzyme [Candidatus Saccharibacteria bacterium]|nr:glycogen debranching enzyme [Candidatus Saccharibacteria bacterium]
MTALMKVKRRTVSYGLKTGLGGVIFIASKAKNKQWQWIRRMYDYRQAPLVLDPQMALSAVTAGNKKAIYASADTLFKGAVFGRDSLEVAEDLMDENPELVRNILTTLAGLQGVKQDNKSEEEPGKIAHEHRERPTDPTSQLIFNELTERWGTHNGKLTYYGSIDATPLFIRVLCQYTRHYGEELLLSVVTRENGQSVAMRQALQDAVTWLESKLKSSQSGLLEYKRVNPRGIENQAWKDSKEFYVHENGQLANHKYPIASIETQGLAYDALMLASEVLADSANTLRAEALKLRDQTIGLLWQPDRGYFALGVDHDNKGILRQIKTKSANPAALLDSRFFDEMSEADRQKYVGAIATTIMGQDFLTDAGIRSRALSGADIVPFWDYHGSHTTWPKETNDIARGLLRQGFPRLSMQLENRLLNAVTRADSYPEFVYIDDDGHMLTAIPHTPTHEDIVVVESTNKPEALQAWTISAVMRILDHRYGGRKSYAPTQSYWQFELEWKILDKMPILGHIHRAEDLKKLYPHRPYRLEATDASEQDSFYSKQVRDELVPA